MARKRKVEHRVQLRRVNLVMSEDDLAWIDQLAGEIRENTRGSLSRSEIVEAGLRTLREIHRLDTAAPLPLKVCSCGPLLHFAGILVVRAAVGPNGEVHRSTAAAAR